MTSLTILKENLTSETFLVELSRARLKRAQLVTNLVTFAWALSQRFGHPRVLGMTIPISLAFWASPSHITAAFWASPGTLPGCPNP